METKRAIDKSEELWAFVDVMEKRATPWWSSGRPSGPTDPDEAVLAGWLARARLSREGGDDDQYWTQDVGAALSHPAVIGTGIGIGAAGFGGSVIARALRRRRNAKIDQAIAQHTGGLGLSESKKMLQKLKTKAGPRGWAAPLAIGALGAYMLPKLFDSSPPQPTAQTPSSFPGRGTINVIS